MDQSITGEKFSREGGCVYGFYVGSNCDFTGAQSEHYRLTVFWDLNVFKYVSFPCLYICVRVEIGAWLNSRFHELIVLTRHSSSISEALEVTFCDWCSFGLFLAWRLVVEVFVGCFVCDAGLGDCGI